MSLHFVLKCQLEAELHKVHEETFDIYQLLSAAQQVTSTASVAYFALTADSDSNDATLASVAYSTAIINEEPIRLRFTAKVAELQAVKDAIQAAEENWTE